MKRGWSIPLIFAVVLTLAAVRAYCPIGTHPVGYVPIQWNEDPEGVVCEDDPGGGPYMGQASCESADACEAWEGELEAANACGNNEHPTCFFHIDQVKRCHCDCANMRPIDWQSCPL